MENLFISGTTETPCIDFNYATGVFKIGGCSLPENVSAFYQKINEWLNSNYTSPQPLTVLEFRMEYFNTASYKTLLEVILKIQNLTQKAGSRFEIAWYYEAKDDDMLDAGHEFAEIVNMDFKYVAF